MRVTDLAGPGAARRTRETPSAPAHAEVADLVCAAGTGDHVAWNRLVDRFSPMVWAVARSAGLSAADAADVCQTTWLRLLEHLHRIEQPERVGGWLATTVRREAVRTSQRSRRSVPTDEHRAFDAVHREPPPDEPVDDLLLGELASAVAELPERSRTLIALLLVEPSLPYTEISETLGMPIGSIGPTRARILATIRGKLEHRGISASDIASE